METRSKQLQDEICGSKGMKIPVIQSPGVGQSPGQDDSQDDSACTRSYRSLTEHFIRLSRLAAPRPGQQTGITRRYFITTSYLHCAYIWFELVSHTRDKLDMEMDQLVPCFSRRGVYRRTRGQVPSGVDEREIRHGSRK